MLGYIEWKGYIKRHPAHARAIEILKEVAWVSLNFIK
jgi:hypothetical protein